jgi:hypothetical protein
MNTIERRRLLAHSVILGLLTSMFCATAGWVLAQTESRPLAAVVQDWPEPARNLAQVMVDKYGQPSQTSDDEIVWLDNGPWKRTIVSRTAQYYDRASSGKAYLEQAIDYRVPQDKVTDIMRFDRKIVVDAAHGELSYCSDSESMNFLALNLADDIARGKRTPAQARRFYAKTEALAAAGKSSPYLDRFTFKAGQSGVIYGHRPDTGYE